ncbi:hypothetical protein FOQG_19382 [Fusarium oxysporum f. sp. raphani 54005]|uniref:Uncharacterized protein n=1 Tax=Fusarium oxysporum f. sp. raphani 54005 TaxID=1089458 RepID=X0BAK1_FUSOX|nr:hypothetical protein FOQG_19382 [Fusarium oxysporum f. sp. raphani 54005]
MAHLIKLATRDREPLNAVVAGLPPSDRSRMEGVSAPSI